MRKTLQGICIKKKRRIVSHIKMKMEVHSLNVADLDNSRNRYWGSRLAVVGTRQAFILALIRWISDCTSLFTNINNTLYVVFSGSIGGAQKGRLLRHTLSIFD